MSIEWLTGVSQILGSHPDVFSCELKIHLRLWCIHCVRAILSPGCAIPSLIFHYQCVCSCVYIWCWLLYRCACGSERVLWEEAKCSIDCNTFKLLSGCVDRVTDWCVTGPGFTPRCVPMWIKNSFKALVYTLCEENLAPGCAIPSLIFHYQCACSCLCIWCWLLCWCACESEWVLWEEAKCSNDRNAFKLLCGYVDRVTDWCVTGPGFAPRRVPLWIKNSFKALVYTLCEDNLVPWLRYSFSDISLSVCLFMCVYMMLVALSMCLRVGRVLWEEAKCSNDCNTFKLIGGYVDRVTDWCVTGHGFAPRRVQLWIKNSFKGLVYTLCEDNLVPRLRYSFSDISLSVCLFICVYMMLVALSTCLRVGAGIVRGS